MSSPFAQPGARLPRTLSRRIHPASLGLLVSASAFGALAAFASSPEQNWPQWRGPLGTGVAPSADPPLTWSETNNVRWKVRIPGEGSATPIVWDNHVFVEAALPTGKKADTPAEKPGSPPAGGDAPATSPPPRGRGMMAPPKPNEFYQFVLLCLDRQTGKVAWQRVAREDVPHEGHRAGDGTFASASAVTDGRHVFAYFGSRGLYCYDLDGQVQWSRDLGRMRVKMGFGEGSSPALYGDTLLINWDNEDDSFLLALDKNTGKTLWKTPRDERTSWATPLVVVHEGKPQVITDASRKIRSYDLATGNLLWECAGLTANVIPSPVAADGVVYCMSGFQGNALLAIRLGRTGDLTDSDAIVWRVRKSTPYVPSPLLYGDKLYFLASNNGILSCLDAKSGQPLIEAERLESLPGVFASPVGGGDRIYLVGRGGATVVVKKSDKLEVVATNRLEEKFDASPAIAGRELFLRGKEYLYCIAER